MLRALARYPLIPAAWLGMLTLGACEALIEKAKPFLQKHLERAQEIQGKLGEAAA